MLRLAVLFALSAIAAVPAAADTVFAEGTAPIVGGDLPAARAMAIRNALGDAARSASLSVRSSSVRGAGAIDFDHTVVRSSAGVHRHAVVAESHDGELYRVALNADLQGGSGQQSGSVCRDGYTKRVLIGGFPMLRPDHLRPDEMTGYAALTAAEMARRFGDNPAVLVDYKGGLMVHFGAPEQVVGDLPADDQALVKIRAAAERHRAQYLLVGRFRSLEASADGKRRDIDVEALVLDGLTGACVARERFSRIVAGEVKVPSTTLFGSAEHYASDFGRAYGEVLAEIAGWAEATVSCQPFSARVLQAEGGRVVFDAGAEHGIGIGDELSAFRTSDRPVTGLRGEVLGVEKRRAGEVRVTAVYPRFSVGEHVAASAGATAGPLRMGDELHAR
jgi:hypothetical protein